MDNKKALGEKKTITYKGKSVTTRVWRYVSEEERQKICTLYYKKPDFDEVKLNFVQIQEGFELVENFTLVNDKRINGLGELNDNDENIMIFMKRDFTNCYKPPIKFNSVWD